VSDLWCAVILGIIEGLTEFLPVSSTGHMIIAMDWLGVEKQAAPWNAFLYFIQIGAITAVIVYFWRRLCRQTFSKPAGGWQNHILPKLVIGVLPAAVVGLSLDDWVEFHLERPVPVAVALVLGAAVMVIVERRFRRGHGAAIEQVTLRQSFLIGLAQCVSIIPGTSRAMATIMGGLLVGLPAATATEFSFYLAIPTLLGAGLVRVLKQPAALGGENAILMAAGFLVAFATAWVVVAGFMRYVQTRSLQPFAVYRVLLGAAVLANAWLGD